MKKYKYAIIQNNLMTYIIKLYDNCFLCDYYIEGYELYYRYKETWIKMSKIPVKVYRNKTNILGKYHTFEELLIDIPELILL